MSVSGELITFMRSQVLMNTTITFLGEREGGKEKKGGRKKERGRRRK